MIVVDHKKSEWKERRPGNCSRVHGFMSMGDEPLHIIASMDWAINVMNHVNRTDAVLRAWETANSGSRRRRMARNG